MHESAFSFQHTIGIYLVNGLLIVYPILYFAMSAFIIIALAGIYIFLGLLLSLILLVVAHAIQLFYCVWFWHRYSNTVVDEMKLKKKVSIYFYDNCY
jgi:hypothetical protein